MAGARRRILVVEDDPETARQILDYLVLLAHSNIPNRGNCSNNGISLCGFGRNCSSCSRALRRRGRRKKINLQVIAAKPVRVVGDRDLLFDAVANIVDNAIKHGREAGQVSVELSRVAGSALISVSDDGPGIPYEEHRNVFRRLYQLERNRRTPGNGLGLSLVAAVARLHDANIKLSDNTPGLKVELQFQLAEGADEKGAQASEAPPT